MTVTLDEITRAMGQHKAYLKAVDAASPGAFKEIADYQKLAMEMLPFVLEDLQAYLTDQDQSPGTWQQRQLIARHEKTITDLRADLSYERSRVAALGRKVRDLGGVV